MGSRTITDECMHLNLIQIVITIYLHDINLARLTHDSTQRSPFQVHKRHSSGPIGYFRLLTHWWALCPHPALHWLYIIHLRNGTSSSDDLCQLH